MTIELRAVSGEDWKVWRSVRLAALAEAPEAFSSSVQDWVDASEVRWRERLSIPGALDLLAFETKQDTPAGMVTGTPCPNNDTCVELISMWIAAAFRSRGVASMLITALVQWAASTGARTLSLSVMPDNEAARRTYEKNGFTVWLEPVDLRLHGRPELVMVRPI